MWDKIRDKQKLEDKLDKTKGKGRNSRKKSTRREERA